MSRARPERGELESFEAPLPPEIAQLADADIANCISDAAHRYMYYYEVGARRDTRASTSSPACREAIRALPSASATPWATRDKDWQPQLPKPDYALLSKGVGLSSRRESRRLRRETWLRRKAALDQTSSASASRSGPPEIDSSGTVK